MSPTRALAARCVTCPGSSLTERHHASAPMIVGITDILTIVSTLREARSACWYFQVGKKMPTEAQFINVSANDLFGVSRYGCIKGFPLGALSEFSGFRIVVNLHFIGAGELCSCAFQAVYLKERVS